MDLPAHQFLEQLGIAHQRLAFPATTEKGAAQVARVLGYREEQMVKTLVFQADTGEKVLVMLGGNKNAVSGNLKRAIGSRNIRLASPEVVKTVTGYEIGSIPPFHWQPPGFRSFLDASLMKEDVVGVGAGVWGNEIIMTPGDVVRAANAIVVDLTGKPPGASPG